MALRRIAFVLSMASVLVMSLVGASRAASADTGPTVTFTAAPDITCSIGQAVDIFGPDNRRGQFICGTTIVTSTGGEEIVIGTDYRVYFDLGHGWSVVPGGAALHTTNPNQIPLLGLFVVGQGSRTIEVLGTTGHYFCNTQNDSGTWNRWTTAGCPQ